MHAGHVTTGHVTTGHVTTGHVTTPRVTGLHSHAADMSMQCHVTPTVCMQHVPTHMQGENQGVVAALVAERDISEGSREAEVNLMIWVTKFVTEVLRREVGIVDRWSSEESGRQERKG